MGQGGQTLGVRPEAVESQGIHGQAEERGHDLHAISLTSAVGVLLELGVAGGQCRVFDTPAVSHVLEQGLCCGPETEHLGRLCVLETIHCRCRL